MWSYECMTLWTAAYHDNWHQLCDDVLSLSIGLGCQPKMKANYSIPFFGLCPIIVNALDIGLAQRVKEQWLGQRCRPDCHDRICLAFMTFAVVIGYSLLMLTIFFLNGFNKWHQLDDLITNRTLFSTQLVYPKSSRVLCAIIKVSVRIFSIFPSQKIMYSRSMVNTTRTILLLRCTCTSILYKLWE